MGRFEIIREKLKELGIDGWLISSSELSDVHSAWLLGIKIYGRHFIYIDSNGHHWILSTRMEKPMIEKALKRRGETVKVEAFSEHIRLKPTLSERLSGKKVAVNFGENIYSTGDENTGFADYIHHGEFKTLTSICKNTEFISSAKLIWETRSVKTSEDIKDLRETVKATMEILETLPDWVKTGMTEKEVQARLEYEYRKLGDIAFEAIIANGPNSADPHHNSSNKKIKEGVLLVDSGLRLDRMCSDITWTYWIGGEPPEDFVQAYNVLLEAKKVADKYFIEGELPKTPAVKCREYLEEKGYDHKKLFTHGLGHSLGYETHDIGYRISSIVETKQTLKANMVYTNEPGLYWQDKWGIRLEDDLIVGKEHPEIVSKCPKDPPII